MKKSPDGFLWMTNTQIKVHVIRIYQHEFQDGINFV